MRKSSSATAAIICIAGLLGNGASAVSQGARKLAGDWTWFISIEGQNVSGPIHIEKSDTMYTGFATQQSQNGEMKLPIVSARVWRDSMAIVVSTDGGNTSVRGVFVTSDSIAGMWSNGDGQSAPFHMRRSGAPKGM